MKKTMNSRAKVSRFFINILLITFILVGCTYEETMDLSPVAMSDYGFNFETKTDVTVNLYLRQENNAPMQGVSIRVYSEDPYVEDNGSIKPWIQPIQRGQSDVNGHFSTVIAIANDIGKSYILIDHISYSQLIVVDKSQKNFSKVIYPNGSSLRKTSSMRSYPDVYYSPVEYSHNSGFLNTGSHPGSKWFVLGSYNTSNYALPNYHEIDEPASTTLKTQISDALPSGVNNAGLAASDADCNLEVIGDCHIWVSFLKEGASLNNTMGYFWYPTGNPPLDSSSVQKRVVVYPNCSADPANQNNSTYSWSGGGALYDGFKVKLLYYNGTNWTDVFPTGVTVGWFLVTNGYGGAKRTPDNSGLDNRWYQFPSQYSLRGLNGAGMAQNVMFFDQVSKKIVLGFEDIGRGNTKPPSSGTSDSDMNDVLFIVSADPIANVNTDVLKRFKEDSDDDGDGVKNKDDDYPTDPLRAFDNYSPGKAIYGSLAFEDNWPASGDYDFNDLVMDYNVRYVTNAQGLIKDIIPSFKVKAIGATNRNGFAIEIPGSPSNVASVTTTYSGPGTLLGGSLFPTNAAGVETGQTKIVVPFFDNAFTVFGGGVGVIPGFPNTNPDDTYYTPVEITKKITFTTPVTVASVGTAPYNPFIIVNQVRAREVHMAGKTPTNKASGYFGTEDDRTGGSKYYVGVGDFPWVLNFTETFNYPTVGINIKDAYLKLTDWVSTGGVFVNDWHSNPAYGYRNSGKIYTRNN